MPFEHDAETGWWRFETDELEGMLEPEGSRHGIKTLTHRPTGVDVVHPDYDVLNLFLLFSTNKCMGTVRDYERKVQAQGESLTVHWPANDDHHAAVTAVYEIVGGAVIDLTITLQSEWAYEAYELFLSSYFDPAMSPHVYLQGSPYTDPPDQAQWVATEVNDVYVGTGLVFPRDWHCSKRPVDGRWTGLWAMYQWNPQRFYELPICMQVDPETNVAAVLMSRPEECFAVVSGYASDNPNDPFAVQNPLYLSLFGGDLLPGDERTAHVRLAITELDDAMQRPLELYEQFAGT
ncbi:MAG: hypothetical protein ACP5KN_11350 [Armatimonadota bacterium]